MKKVCLIALSFLQFASANAQTLWEKNEGCFAGANVGYVTKDWVTNFHDGSSVYHENLWGKENRRLHGVQLGFDLGYYTEYGFGGRTGLSFEYFYSPKSEMYDNFNEYNLYLPLHALFQIPIAEDWSVILAAGLGCYYVITSTFTNDNDYEYDYNWYQDTYYRHKRVLDHLDYNERNNPNRLNAALELSLGVKYSIAELKFMYSRGLTNHSHFYEDYPKAKTRQDLFAITLSFTGEL